MYGIASVRSDHRIDVRRFAVAADARQLTQGIPPLARTGGPDSGVGNVVS